MKANIITAANTVDRLATADEIRAALLPDTDHAEENDVEIFHEIAADTGGYVRISSSVFETAIMVEALTRDEAAKVPK